VAANFFTVAGATTVTNSANGVDISAVFPATGAAVPPTYTLTITAANGGSITQGTSGNYAAGAVISISASAYTNYVFSGWTATGGSITNASSANTTFIMPAGAVTLTGNFSYVPPYDYYDPYDPTPTTPPTPTTETITKLPEGADGFTATLRKTRDYAAAKFTDVPAGKWYADNVKFAYEWGLFNGTNIAGYPATFSPEDGATRAQVITVLARAAGVDTTIGETWYSEAVAWAMATGLSDGTNLDVGVTREQLATLLWRFAGRPLVFGDVPFPDAGKISDWAADAAVWAVSKGIIVGADGLFNPQGYASRIEIAIMIERYVKS
jgi:hypothetical protein